MDLIRIVIIYLVCLPFHESESQPLSVFERIEVCTDKNVSNVMAIHIDIISAKDVQYTSCECSISPIGQSVLLQLIFNCESRNIEFKINNNIVGIDNQLYETNITHATKLMFLRAAKTILSGGACLFVFTEYEGRFNMSCMRAKLQTTETLSFQRRREKTNMLSEGETESPSNKASLSRGSEPIETMLQQNTSVLPDVISNDEKINMLGTASTRVMENPRNTASISRGIETMETILRSDNTSVLPDASTLNNKKDLKAPIIPSVIFALLLIITACLLVYFGRLRNKRKYRLQAASNQETTRAISFNTNEKPNLYENCNEELYQQLEVVKG